MTACILWKRLDTAGHDACSLASFGDGWRLTGAAAFAQDGQPCFARYDVQCDAGWRTIPATVDARVGVEHLILAIARSGGGRWLLNGIEQRSVDGYDDLDLAFTPARRRLGQPAARGGGLAAGWSPA